MNPLKFLATQIRKIRSGVIEAKLSVPGQSAKMSLLVHSLTEHVSNKMLEVGVWEPTESECVIALVDAGDFVIDVGANIGYYTVLLAGLVGSSGSLISIEPDRRNYKLLRKNLKHNNIVGARTVRAAAGQTQGQGRIYHSESNFGDHRSFPNQDQSSSSVVNVVKLDQIITDENRSPKLVKIDCQGAEIGILQGMAETLSQAKLRPKVLILEFWPYGLEQSGGSASTLLSLISTQNYVLWDIGRWQATPHRTTREALEDLALGFLAPADKLFTNLILISNEDEELIRRMDRLCTAS